MIEVANQIKVENSGDIELVNVFALENMLYISIPENSYWSGYCVIYQMTGQIETRQDLLRGANLINHSFAKGQYLVTLSLGRKMIINKIEIE